MRRTLRFLKPGLLGVAVLASGFSFGANAQGYDLSALHWRNIGPARGGRSQAVAGSAARPLEYYFGADGGGLWKSTDGGVGWHPVTDGQLHSSSVSAVAVAASNPDIVYAGTGETALRGDIIQGDGIYKSTDDGKSWKHVGLADSQAISRILVDPQNPDIVYAAVLGHPYGPNTERGVYRSVDGGSTWKRVLYRNDRCGAADLAMDPHHPKVLFASIWDAYRTPWTLSSGGPGSGLFKSADGGDTWTEISRNHGMPKGILGKITVSVSGADSNRVYAMVEAEDGGLFQSDDAGATWKLVNADHKIRQRAFYFSTILADPKVRDRVYALNVEFYRSDDGGKTFDLLHTGHNDHHDMWIAPNDPRRMIVADDGGGVVSTDGGQTWTARNYSTAQFYHVAITSDFPYHVCGAQQDSGAICVPTDQSPKDQPYTPESAGIFTVGASEAGYIAADPKHANLFYVGDQAGFVTRFDEKTNETESITVYPLFFSGMSAGVLPQRWQWTFPIVFSPIDPNVLYTSSQHLWKTSTQGHEWQSISPDLTRNDPKTLGDSGGPITKDQNGPEIYGTIFTIAPSHFSVNTIWTGSDDGIVSLTRDGGKTWKNVTPEGLGDFNRVSFMDASPHDPATAYLAAKRYQLDDRHPYIYKTHDFGKTWTKIVSGIPDDDFAQVVREDPVRRGLLYAGTEHGVYVSFDDGGRWQSLSLNVPDTQVADLTFARNDLVIATHGRGFYVLNDIGLLRQFTPVVVSRKAFLFAPSNAIRFAEPAAIDYWLSEPAHKVRIEILDPRGKIVRSFTSGSVTAATTGAETNPNAQTNGAGAEESLPATSGTHRLVWDLRYDGAASFPGLILREAHPGQGPFAPPGRYTIRLTANGQAQSQTLVIERDPRLTALTDTDFELKFKLAMQIRDATDRANRAVIQIRAIDAQLAKRVTEVDDATVSTEAKAIRSKLDACEQELYQTKNRSPRDTLNYPIKLNNQLAVLQVLVDEGSHRPTVQDYVVFRELSGELDHITKRIGEILRDDLAGFNRTLANDHLPPVEQSTR